MNRRMIKLVSICIAIAFAFAIGSSLSKAQEEELPPLKVVHIGDSYSAGNGARSASGDRNDQGVNGCYRSPTNWGSQFVDSLRDVFNVTYVNRACSGGVISNITSERVLDKNKVFKKLDGSCPSPDYPDEEILRPNSGLTCTRSLKPQIDAIDESVDLVIMTMGGNDVNFAEIVKHCFVKPTLGPVGCRKAVNNASTNLADVQKDLTDTFREIRSKLRPDAKVVLFSYPQLVPDIGYTIFRRFPADSYAAGDIIRSMGLEGDRRQKAAVDAANAAAGEDFVTFFDGTKALFEGHLLNPLDFDSNPDRWLFHPFETKKPMEWYHFNPSGHQNFGNAISVFESFGAVGGSFEKGADIDVVFVVDTTGSMGDEIAQVRRDLSNLVNQLAATTDSYRVAVVSYRDFPERTENSVDYPSRVDQVFTNDLTSIQAAIDSLDADGGGDVPESVFSGIQAAIGLTWRPGVAKLAIIIGDAPALSPEPISNLTAAQIVANSIAVDPVQVIGVDVGNLNSNGALEEIALGTGGAIIPATSGLTSIISDILLEASGRPLAWMGSAYSGKIEQPIHFNALGSYDPSGLPITLYEWDFNGDGVFDLETEEATATHVYDAAFNDFVVLRVTGAGGTALASARTTVNTMGYAPQGDEEPCELDENGISIFVDSEGQFIRCTPDQLPDTLPEGVDLFASGTAPDLVVQSLSVTENEIQVTIRNNGPGMVPSEYDFWVDVYVDPDILPTRVNETWQFQGDQGAVWGVTAPAVPMQPGDTVILSLGDSYYWPTLSALPVSIPPGTAVYAQVDSANADTAYGGVLENHELNGGAYNNIFGPVLSVDTSQLTEKLYLPAVIHEGISPSAGKMLSPNKSRTEETLPFRP